MAKIAQAFAKFRGGIHLSHSKNTKENVTAIISDPSLVVIPMQQHIGGACQPIVKKKDVVKIGQVIGQSTAYVSAPIHASISGKVKAIKPILLSNGKMCEAIHIENDGLQTLGPDLKPITVRSKDELLQAAYDSGLVGIGGAGFPLHVKLANKENHFIDCLIVNGAECEPYITSDYREMMEYPQRIIAGMEIVMRYLGIKKGIIGIEENKPEAIERINNYLQDRADTSQMIEVMALPVKYPQGAEKMLVYATTGRKIGKGKLPAQAGCLVLNVSTVSLFQHYLETGIPLVSKRITVSGDSFTCPQNVSVPLGTSIGELVEFCGGFSQPPNKLILGGPMMGIAQYTLDIPITKQNNALIALGKGNELPDESPCIRCGRCVTACPLSLMPVQIERSVKMDDAAMLQKLNASACMECGCCSYVCPSGRKLVQYMKQAKVIAGRANT
ncbi:electron transport complex subunit RsxC [Enterococcus sp. BWR-S5]|uniref:electron transport complex subunit RsxC n=1 Tax=Enterococcus sp. BWR-S5 TaxID=2787714 RepID=UPI0019220B2D|nr:electron transport complex subunit RsxC [Enterococcus sp. BWR-S5]